MDILEMPVSGIKGVGPKKQVYLHSAGIKTLEDLLYYFPRSYEDRSRLYPLVQIPHKQRVGVRARVIGGPVEKRINRRLTVIKVAIEDDSGRGWAVWFNNPYPARQLKTGSEYLFFGKGDRRFEIQLLNPDVQKADQRVGIVPVYPSRGRLTPGEFERFIRTALELASGKIKDVFPEEIRVHYDLGEINYCLKNIHYPEDYNSLRQARRRLVFQELFLLQMGLLQIKKSVEDVEKGIFFAEKEVEEIFLKKLPFDLTAAQKRVYGEIKKDMESSRIMNRLVQGDVGSGKTVIAVMALLKAVANGYQGALMVPTEILAEQHYSTLTDLLKGFDVKARLLTGSCSKKERERIYSDIREGHADIIVGTHSLVQGPLEFARLGLVVTDEQHRFGVRQRALLFGKGKNPDVLVMTATPIPRTLALILYGDLDISIIDEMPPGRKTVETYAVDKKIRDRVYKFVGRQLSEGRQAYIVCPLIEESDVIEAVPAAVLYEELKRKYLKGYRIELMHGRMTGLQKEEIMREFRDGKINALVSTTVVEVGVNVANANIMVIENAERFGLAQLHQLRGRVGRGKYQSYCILVNHCSSRVAGERIKTLCTISDGFKIAEKDLTLRGPGDFFGTRQHGLPDLKIARLPADMDILKDAQQLALKIIKQPDARTDAKWRQAFEKIEKLCNENNLPQGTI